MALMAASCGGLLGSWTSVSNEGLLGEEEQSSSPFYFLVRFSGSEVLQSSLAQFAGIDKICGEFRLVEKALGELG